MIMELISIALGVILLGAIDYGSGWIELPRLGYLVDIPSLVIILVLTVPVLFKGGLWRDFKRAWRLLWKDYNCHLIEVRRFGCGGNDAETGAVRRNDQCTVDIHHHFAQSFRSGKSGSQFGSGNSDNAVRNDY